MNLVDRTHLHRLGFAFLRRFASVLFPSALREFRSSLRDVEAPEDLRRHVISIAAKEAYRELTLSSADIGIESDRSLYSATISERSIEEACRYYDRALRAFLQLAQSVSEIGVEIGYSAFVDVVKLLAVAFLIEFRDEALLADVAASSILLPHVGSVLPRMRAEVLLVGRSRRVEAFEKLVASVLEIFGEGSRSAYCCEVLSLELPQPIDMR
ncbi:MAG: hypothetical protein GXO32_00495 [Crenarchaeota archaeon]|nr:hypothetical protein [Thermoproteota archaeon]